MYNNCVLLCCFLWPCWLVYFVVYFDYFLIKIMFERMWRDDYLLECSVWYIIKTDIKLSVIWYIACVDWLSMIAMTDVYVTLTPNSSLIWGYPHISGQNKTMIPQFDFTPIISERFALTEYIVRFCQYGGLYGPIFFRSSSSTIIHTLPRHRLKVEPTCSVAGSLRGV